jgi:hypothetical protein
MTPRAAYLAISGMVNQDNNGVACDELLAWLQTSLVRRGAGQQPRTSGPPLGTLTFLDPQLQQAFTSYCLALAQQDVPQLQPGMHHNSAIMIAQGISTLTQEQRLTRQEAQQSREDHDTPKTAGDYFGVLLPRLMRWCQVATETDLPSIYEILTNTKKGKIRSTLQIAVEEVLTNRHYLEDFPLSRTLANKIIDLKWHSALKDDFTVGINVFGCGSLAETSMEEQRRLNK